ncbi:MAG: hypothetical protein LBB09_01815 [Rickettsiales bacterium]|jgi:hypothetical protein|nr:hypothetical protein [Rickettsiales bacterium]
MKTADLVAICFFLWPLLARAAEAKAPEWYGDKPKNDNLYIYETGEGKTKKLAVENALDNLHKNFNAWIGDGADINFPSYSLKQTQTVGNTFYALLSFNRNEFFQLQLKEFQSEREILLGQLADLENKNKLLMRGNCGDVFETVERMRKKVLAAKFLGDFDGGEFKKILKKTEEACAKFQKKDAAVSLELDERLSPLREVIEKYFANKNIKIRDGSKNVFSMKIDLEKDYLYGNFLISGNIKFFLREQKKILRYGGVDLQCASAISRESCFSKIISQAGEIFSGNKDVFDYEKQD